MKIELTKSQRLFGYGLFAIVILLALTTFFIKQPKQSTNKPIYTENVNGLQVEVFNVKLTTDEDDGKVIVNIPVTLTNKSDHAFVFSVPHFYYNKTSYVLTLFALDEGDVGGKIKRDETKSGTITVKLKTRDKSKIKTIQPTISIYDMKNEKTTEFEPNISVK